MNILFLSLSFSTSKHKSFYEDLLCEFQKEVIKFMLHVLMKEVVKSRMVYMKRME